MESLNEDLDAEIMNTVDELLVKTGGEGFKNEWHADFVRYALEAEGEERLFEVAKTNEKVKRVLHSLLRARAEVLGTI